MSERPCCTSCGSSPGWWVRPRLERARELARADAPSLVGLAESIAPSLYPPWVRAALLLQAVQEVTRYELDGDESRAPLETWARGVGDCADAAPLLASLCAAAGIPARLAYRRGRRIDHLTVMVDPTGRGRWAWAEPTVRGARVGESPEAAARRLRPGRADLS